MQQLHLVGFTADNQGLIFSARKGTKSGGYVVTIDPKLLSRVEEIVARREADEEDERLSDRPKSSLSPREIQARLRAGRTIQQVAREAGVEEDWVARWAAPIAAEQAQVVERAQALVLEKNRTGLSAVVLGESVRWNMAEKGIVFTDAGWAGSWDAFHLRDNSWIVRFSYVYRRKTQQGEWEVDTRDAAVVSRNRQGTELGYVAPGRRRPKMPRSVLAAIDLPAVAPAAPTPVPSSPALKANPKPKPRQKPRRAARRAPARPKSAKKALPRAAAATKAITRNKKAAAKKSAAKKSAAKKAAPGRATRRPVAKKRKAATRRAPAKKRPAASPQPIVRVPRPQLAAPLPPPSRPRPTPALSLPAQRSRSGSGRPKPLPRPSARRPPARPAAGKPRREPRRADSAEVSSPERREVEGFPRPAARTPIRIDSGVPRRTENGSPIIRADRADQSREETAANSVGAGDAAAPRSGRFRFRRGRKQ